MIAISSYSGSDSDIIIIPCGQLKTRLISFGQLDVCPDIGCRLAFGHPHLVNRSRFVVCCLFNAPAFLFLFHHFPPDSVQGNVALASIQKCPLSAGKLQTDYLPLSLPSSYVLNVIVISHPISFPLISTQQIGGLNGHSGNYGTLCL